MNKYLIFILVVICLSGCNKQTSIGYESTESALENLKALPDAKIRKENGWTIISHKENNNFVIWSFAPEQHPAYPAVAKRTIIDNNGEVSTKMNIHCDASKINCDNFYKSFVQLLQKTQNEINNKTK